MTLSNAERQARWRARQKEKFKAAEGGRDGALKARVRELEAEVARLRAGKAARPEPPPMPDPRTPDEWEVLKRAATEARKAKRAAGATNRKLQPDCNPRRRIAVHGAEQSRRHSCQSAGA